MIAIGHFGNFEIYARTVQDLEGYRAATTYRGIKQRRLNALLLSLRRRSGCLTFERRTEGRLLRKAIGDGGLVVGLLSDQHAGRSGVRLPFFGRECSAQSAPALFSLRYQMPLHTAICYRLAPGRWRIEIGDEIATRHDGKARAVKDITADINRALEEAVRRDPANWFWVHNRWKKAPAAQLEKK
jgi:KDO2-lipid IV(A) lauroyltransferase